MNKIVQNPENTTVTTQQSNTQDNDTNYMSDSNDQQVPADFTYKQQTQESNTQNTKESEEDNTFITPIRQISNTIFITKKRQTPDREKIKQTNNTTTQEQQATTQENSDNGFITVPKRRKNTTNKTQKRKKQTKNKLNKYNERTNKTKDNYIKKGKSESNLNDKDVYVYIPIDIEGKEYIRVRKFK
jgi:hypothetical protein